MRRTPASDHRHLDDLGSGVPATACPGSPAARAGGRKTRRGSIRDRPSEFRWRQVFDAFELRLDVGRDGQLDAIPCRGERLHLGTRLGRRRARKRERRRRLRHRRSDRQWQLRRDEAEGVNGNQRRHGLSRRLSTLRLPSRLRARERGSRLTSSDRTPSHYSPEYSRRMRGRAAVRIVGIRCTVGADGAEGLAHRKFVRRHGRPLSSSTERLARGLMAIRSSTDGLQLRCERSAVRRRVRRVTSTSARSSEPTSDAARSGTWRSGAQFGGGWR